MEKIIKQWEKRSLSPIGKITVIKTLIIPIFNLLFIALANPDSVISDQINKTLYNFLWNKKAKIKTTIVVKQYAEGGLKMINLNAFINALKSTWIRRLLTSDSKWQEFIKMHVNLEKLFKSFLDINRMIEETEEQILTRGPLVLYRSPNC